MVSKKPNFIYKFDSKEYSKEEQEYLIYRFISCLMRIEAKQQALKSKSKKEQKQIENELMNFGLNTLKRVESCSAVDKFNTRTFENVVNIE